MLSLVKRGPECSWIVLCDLGGLLVAIYTSLSLTLLNLSTGHGL